MLLCQLKPVNSVRWWGGVSLPHVHNDQFGRVPISKKALKYKTTTTQLQ